MKNCCAGIVLHNPEPERLKENMAAIENQVETIILVDNNSLMGEELLREYQKPNKFIIRNKENAGVATALNQICEKSLSLGYEWVLLLDQDSVCSSGMMDAYNRYASEESIALLTPYIIDINKLTVAEYSRMKLPEISEVEWAITSGSAIRLQAWVEIGGFDEGLFIDSVDIDYSRRLKINGYKQIRVNKEYLLQEVGHAEPTWIRRIHVDNSGKYAIKRYYRSNHSLLRQYYMARNSIIVARKYKRYNSCAKAIFRSMIIAAAKLLVEKQKWKLFKTLLKGFCDGTTYQVEVYEKKEDTNDTINHNSKL